MGGHGHHHHANTTTHNGVESEPKKSRKTSIATFFISGAGSGVTEHVVMYPIDTVKTRIQAYASTQTTSPSTLGLLGKILKNEGFGIYRGVTVVALSSIPAHACYFAAYEWTKNRVEHARLKTRHDVDFLATSAAGAAATTVHDFITVPFDVLKQRLQLSSSYQNVIHCAKDTLRHEGIRSLYRSFPTTLLMNIPQGIAHFYAYETFKHLFPMNDEGDHHSLHHLIAGAGAGAISAAFSTPIDVIKTRLQTQTLAAATIERVTTGKEIQHQIRYRGLVDTTQTLFKEGGYRIFFRGAMARVLYTMPSASITWIVYEFLKKSI